MFEAKNQKNNDKALLIGFYPQPEAKSICEEHLRELGLLVNTFGVEVTQQISSVLKKIHPATYMGSGKLQELATIAKADQYNLIVIDEEISPAQQRNLEKAFQAPVMERTEIILGVFAQRAQTKEAKLQIELASARYQLPRLKRMWTHLSRQRGGAVNLKGEGEKQIEIDRRLLGKQIKKLEKEIQKVHKQRVTQRSKRLKSSIPTFGIIGYTNAGKSTLLKGLTEANVFIEDKLFATLDTTIKKFTLPNHQQILLVDTVGFIRKIPHSLVMAFKSTLEESLYTDILLHVVDASNPMAHEQAETTLSVLKELKADKKPMITILNKMDQCENKKMINRLRVMFSHTVCISALHKEGFDDLFSQMIKFLEKLTKIMTFLIPQKEFNYFSDLLREGTVLEHEYQDNNILVKACCPLNLVSKIDQFQVTD